MTLAIFSAMLLLVSHFILRGPVDKYAILPMSWIVGVSHTPLVNSDGRHRVLLAGC